MIKDVEELRLNGVEDVKSIRVELLVTLVGQGSYREWGEVNQVGKESWGAQSFDKNMPERDRNQSLASNPAV